MGATIVWALALLIAAGYLIVRPLLARETAVPEEGDRDLLDRKERLLAEIRELDIDLATGKLSEEDHRALRASSVAEAATTMRAIASAEMLEPEPSASERLSADPPIGTLDDQLEELIAARKRSLRGGRTR
jgi:hypothetical protein